MKEFKYTITDPVGIHARPAGQLVKAAKALTSHVTIRAGKKEADATRLMAVMGMGVTQGMEVTVELSGEDEEQDYATLKEFFEKNL